MLIREAFMEKRRLGRTGHSSSVITFGSAALWNASQSEADAAIELALEHGINHFDVAPVYGKAEQLLGPWMEKHNKEIFLWPARHRPGARVKPGRV